MNTVRVRFAPSPTGHLHIGSLRSALFNWLWARHTGGAFLMRIEDTDRERSRDEYTRSILDAFAWCGIVPDEPVMVQSERTAVYQQVARELVEKGLAYVCTCSPDELAARLGANAADGAGYVRYDGKCRDSGNPLTEGRAIRLRIPAGIDSVTFDDMVHGLVTFGSDSFDDFIIIRSDGMPTYNFAVVIDDAWMRITHVIRGEEHLVNTPKQMFVYEACGYTMPRFAHIPLILGPDGKKLSKRDAATSVVEYRDMGYLPDALINYLVRLGWSHGDQEIFTQDELIAAFDISAIGKKGSIFDHKKLDWVNGVYLKQKTPAQLVTYVRDVMGIDAQARYECWSAEQIGAAVVVYRERVATVRALVESIDTLYHVPHLEEAVTLSPEFVAYVSAITLFDVATITTSLKQWCSEHKISLGIIGPQIRLALTGVTSAPGIADLMAILGRDETVRRLRASIRI